MTTRITLLQLDNEISQLQIDADQLAVDYDPTQEPPTTASYRDNRPTSASGEEAPAARFDPLEVLDQLMKPFPTRLPASLSPMPLGSIR